MLIIKLKRNKIGTAISTFDPALSIALEVQREALSNWATKAAKLIISGPETPPSNHGVRHVKTASTAPIANLLATYLQSIPGAEVCMLANPDCLIGDVMPLLNHIDAQKMELAWAAHVDFGNKPSVFFLSSPVIAHMMNDLPQGMTFKNDWQFWVHNWFQRLLRYRYFDATPFSPVAQITGVVVTESVTMVEGSPPPEPTPAAPEPEIVSTRPGFRPATKEEAEKFTELIQQEPKLPTQQEVVKDIVDLVTNDVKQELKSPTQQAEELSSLTLPVKRNKGPLKKVKVK